MVERSLSMREVRGSMPRFSTKNFHGKIGRHDLDQLDKKWDEIDPASGRFFDFMFARKYIRVENRGIDPRASRMRIERSTI